MIKCPYCREDWNDVKNSRSTLKGSQVWRRRLCRKCNKTFTTYERVIPTLTVIKKSGKRERYNRFNIYTSIYKSAPSWRRKEELVDRITNHVEVRILDSGVSEINTHDISNIIMKVLRVRNIDAFLRYLTYSRRPKTESEFLGYLKEFKKR